MEAKEKAKELFEQFLEYTVEWDKLTGTANDSKYYSKQCALLAVDEILEVIIFNKYDDKYWEEEEYWEEVKQEIEKHYETQRSKRSNPNQR